MAVTGTPRDGARLLCWAGADAAGERAARAEVAEALRTGAPAPRPVPGPVRGAVVTTGARALDDLAAAPVRRVPAEGPRPVVLLLPGQGSQREGMATGLYRDDPVFRAAVDEVLEAWGAEGEKIRADWLGTGTGPGIPIDDGRRAQPLLFAVDYGLGRLLMSWGVTPAEALGHSAGEVVAATLAGAFTLREAVALVRGRVRAAASVPPGGMVAVAASVDELVPYLSGQVAVAAVNAPRRTMLAGPSGDLAAVAERLTHDRWTLRPVPATTPFHSPAMEPAVAAAERAFDARPRPVRFPVRSGYTGRLLTAEETGSARFWARQIADPVHFGPALTALLAGGHRLLVECGPGRTLTSLAFRQSPVYTGGTAVVPMLPGDGPDGSDRSEILQAAAALWCEGHELALGDRPVTPVAPVTGA
ncbi:acyltransferase domain-containing protein [Streptomyces sp. C11-1]|uniref:Acyltransferase domain-containing protein n=1 Tax=Streptomyces durocortorensis TaxID=2811104 RepID=A0ABY9VWV2_9ACTN|nr:acyltransferase domain-containing protein [Streptomyces durocortorensis]WNF28385.1 acyltransferase domain-containing protein [Streptomyces durocortorensis]